MISHEKRRPIPRISGDSLEIAARCYAAGFTPDKISSEYPNEAALLRYCYGIVVECGLEDQFTKMVDKFRKELQNQAPESPHPEPEPEIPVQMTLFSQSYRNEEDIAAQYLTPEGKKNYSDKRRRDRKKIVQDK